FELGGQGALILTEPSRASDRFGLLEFPTGAWLVQRGSENGPVVAEIASAGERRRITVPEGKYFVSRRERDYLLEGTFSVAPKGSTTVETRGMREVAYAQVVRKGGTATNHSWSAYVMGTARSAQLDAGPAAGAEVGVRLDLRPLTLQVGLAELRGSTSQISRPGLEYIDSREYAATITALRVFDVDRWSFGVGAAAGGAQLTRSYDRSHWLPPPPGTNPGPPFFDNNSLGVYAGPAAAAELRVWRALHVRAEANWTAEMLQVRNDPPSAPIDRLITSGRVRGGLAFGWFF
ncbi:MAG TPA: hypothetical protein VMV18_15330, partial [bacterium]|nr:hypothetical protein [bacterium]